VTSVSAAHIATVRGESAWLADYADYGIRATEDQGGFVDGDSDSHRANLVAALDALAARIDTMETLIGEADAVRSQVGWVGRVGSDRAMSVVGLSAWEQYDTLRAALAAADTADTDTT
jgi:hypothetical protein